MKERNFRDFTALAPPVGRRWASSLGGGIFKRYYGEFSTGVDRNEYDRTHELQEPDRLLLLNSHGTPLASLTEGD